MDHIPFEPPVDRSSPRHQWFGEVEQYRLKLRRFTKLPPEFTVQRISFQPDIERYQKAAACARSIETTISPRRRAAPKNDEPRSAESLENSQRRAHTKVRLLVQELAPTALVTFTTRETMPLEALMWCWQYFTRLLRTAGMDYQYVAVPERHPTNPEHLHLHVAYRGRTPYGTLRRFWHMALEARHGRKLRHILRGSDSPGNIDVQNIKARDGVRRIRKIAKYVSKYITKDLISEFNRKRYWPSKGIDLADAAVFWLDSLSQSDAIREACRMLGQWDDEMGFTPQKLFTPSERVCWCAIDPDKTPPPPF